MKEMLNTIEAWFASRPKWQQDTVSRIINKGNIDETDLNELTRLCKQEAGIQDTANPAIKAQSIPAGAFNIIPVSTDLHLEEISGLQGINALSPRNPLVFGKAQLSIVYGQNGSGKSGYVRTLKHACGAKSPGALYGNVYQSSTAAKSCKFKINDGKDHEIPWDPATGVCDDLKQVEIYDTDCGNIYLTRENTVTYEPPLLILFSILIHAMTQIGLIIKAETDRLVSSLPVMPPQFTNTEAAGWFRSLSHKTTQDDINKFCSWDVATEKQLTDVKKRLGEADPARKARQLRVRKGCIINLHDRLVALRDKVSDPNFVEYIRVKEDAATKRKAADEDAKKVFENAPLKGVGSESWRLLWEQARIFSETEAYKEITFPNGSDDSRCVLCQQLLQPNAKDRFSRFENFVKGKLQKLADTAEATFKDLKTDLETMISSKELGLLMDAANITDEAEKVKITKYYDRVVERCDIFIKAKKADELPKQPQEEILANLTSHSDRLERQAKKFDDDACAQNREALKKKADDFEARKWLSGQKAEVEKEVRRKKKVRLLDRARSSANTGPVSTKKSDLANILITPEFIRRFKDELKFLGATRIQVELVKTRTDRGRVLHKLQLHNCLEDICPTKILSEGEFRIVSLAAFLADVTGREQKTPFIFDDPISSLDQDFEERTVARLIELCEIRQVIVFTHRLSLFILLQEVAKKKDIEANVCCLRIEGKRIGEPGITLVNERKPKNALNFILNNRLPQAKKALEEGGWADYEPLGGNLCRDIRILLERLIENDLVSDVVQRFRREIITKNKIVNLSKINSQDCKFLDDYMTKYSVYAHSHSPETPVQVLDPDELEKDVSKILEWLDEFKNRKVAA